MDNVTIFLSEYLEQNKLNIIVKEYYSNGISDVTGDNDEIMFAPSDLVCLADISRELPIDSNRFSLVDYDGRMYTHFLTKDQFEEELVDALNPPFKEVLHHNYFDLDEAETVIKQAESKGFFVYSYVGEVLEHWSMYNIDAFGDLLEKIKVEGLDDHNPAIYLEPGTIGGKKGLFDESGNMVFEEATEPLIGGKTYYFDIQNQQGDYLVQKLSRDQVLPVLFLLMEDYPTEFIYEFLLRYGNESDDGNAYGYDILNYFVCNRTRKMPIKNRGDLFKSYNILKDRGESIPECEYRCWSDWDQRYSSQVILAHELTLIWDNFLNDDEEEKDGVYEKQLSRQLVSIAEKNGYMIQQQDRFHNRNLVLDGIEYSDGKLLDYARLLFDEQNPYDLLDFIPIERVYDLIDRETGEYVIRESTKERFLLIFISRLFNDQWKR